MKILVFAATNHKKSINKKLAKYAASLLPETFKTTIIDLNNFELPLFSPELCEEKGIPSKAKEFFKLIKSHDGIIISFAEYNGSYTPVFKNLIDWASQINQKLWQKKPTLLLATSPGKRGAQTVLQQATDYFPFMDAIITGTFSLPSFPQNFQNTKITNPTKNKQLHTAIQNFTKATQTKHTSNQPPNWTKTWSKIWVWIGWGFFFAMIGASLINPNWIETSLAMNIWRIALYAACFTLTIRPIFETLPYSKTLEGLLSWRKGIGLISSSIVVSFWLSRYVLPLNWETFISYFSNDNWHSSLNNYLTRTTEITALILFTISNKWMIKNHFQLWRFLQKTSYLYFLSASIYVGFILEKTYALWLLIIFLASYLAWSVKRFLSTDSPQTSSRKTQAS